MDPARLLRNPVFAQLEPRELARLAAFATEESFAAGTRLVRQGDFSTELYVIEEGTAAVVRDGQEVDQVGRGDVIGEIGVLEKTKRNADILVREPLLAIKVTHWEIRRLSPETIAKLQAIAADHKGSSQQSPGPVLD
jgi:CRP/FNR family transcriptional regulator, cyclic AMP receptor protein